MSLMQELFRFRPSKMALIFATKTFIAGMLALFVSFELDLINPMWSIGTVLIIASPYSGMVSSKCIYRLIGTAVGAFIALILTPNLINTPWLFTLILSIWVGFALYISLLDRTPRSAVFMLAGYTTAMIVYNAVTYIDQYSIFDIAIARLIEISIGVISSAVVSATLFPLHIGAAIKQRVSQSFKDSEMLFKDLFKAEPEQNSGLILAALTRDSTDIHALAVHLNYEKGELHGMTKALQEMLHQMSLVVANLVAMSERLKQLKQISAHSTANQRLSAGLTELSEQVLAFLDQARDRADEDLFALPADYAQSFARLDYMANAEQQLLLAAIKMDMRHFISNVLAVMMIWRRIQSGNKELPAQMMAITTAYPSLHRDHGVAVRGGVSAFLITFIVTGLWIITGWKAGFMMAQIGAVTACILTALDNPVPVLKIFVWGSVASAVLVFIYAFGVFPHVTAFWQLALVLFPMVLISVSMMTHQMLMPIGMVLGINTMMGLNLHNRYSMDAVSYLDSSFGMILGVLVSLIVINLVRAMSPETSAGRILALHYRAVRSSINMQYGLGFKVHLRSMLDRIGVLNTKPVQSAALKQAIHAALIESSAVIDLTRLQELSLALPSDHQIVQHWAHAQQTLQLYFAAKEAQWETTPVLLAELEQQFQQLATAVDQFNDPDFENLQQFKQRFLISLNNIEQSLCHLSVPAMRDSQGLLGEVVHG